MLEVKLIDADGWFVTANANFTSMTSPDLEANALTDETDLFWALRGGGGSTW